MAQLFKSAIGPGEASHCNVKDIKHSWPPYFTFAVIIPMRGEDQKDQTMRSSSRRGWFPILFQALSCLTRAPHRTVGENY